jgi:hypothetical protein
MLGIRSVLYSVSPIPRPGNAPVLWVAIHTMAAVPPDRNGKDAARRMSMLNPAAALQWTGPFLIEHVRENHCIIDQGSGVYVFALSDLPLSDGRGVL